VKDRLAYFAGIVDGEGSIGFCGRSPRLCISLRKGDDQPIRLMARMWRWKLGEIPPRNGSKTQTLLQIYGHDARDFLRMIRPWLLIKHRQADLLIDFVDKFRPRRYQHIDEDRANEVVDYIFRMRVLNKTLK
jgi:hypothetical protein